MPNHIQNNLSFDCDSIRMREILESIQFDEESENEQLGLGTFDFNKIIPRPTELDIEDSTSTINGMSLYLTKANPHVTHYGSAKDKMSEEDILKIFFQIKNSPQMSKVNPSLTPDEIAKATRHYSDEELIDLGKQAIQNIQNYGAATWYGWSIVNWGTKWNSYSNSYNDETKMLSFQTAWSAPHPILAKLSAMYPDVTIKHQWADEDLGHNCGMKVYLGGDVIDEYYPEGRFAMEWAADTWDCDLGDCCLLLNASETDYINVIDDEYELISYDDQPMLFSNERITRKDIPQGYYCYDIRQSDDQTEFCSIERHVLVNHGGSIITKEPLNFNGADHIPLTYDNGLNFIGHSITFGEYMTGDFEMEEEGGMCFE